MRDVDVASVVAKAIVKFKESEEFNALLKDYHNGYDVRVVEIFYNIWVKYQDLDFTFLEGELTNLISEWLEAERLNAPNVVPSSPPSGPSVEDITSAKSVPSKAPEQQPVANADEEAATSNPLLAVEEPVGEVTSGVAVRTIINLKEEPVAISDTKLLT